MNCFPSSRATRCAAALGLAAALLATGSALADDAPAAAAAAAAAVPNKGDTAWMLVSSALVLMMSIPGLALFYGGLVRTKNMLSILTQVFMTVSLVGVPDYTAITTGFVGTYDFSTQMITQLTAVVATLLWSGIGSAILYKIVDLIVGLRAAPDKEREGLDLADHGERAYNY